MPKAYLGLGSNVGDRKGYLRAAVIMIKANPSIKVTQVSSVYETEAVGYRPQRQFLNIVVEIETSLSSHRLIMICQYVERFFKRRRSIKRGPRTIDLDMLLYGQEQINDPELVIPHPQMSERAFVLIPLLEIAPNATFPGGKPIRYFLGGSSVEGVRRSGNL